MNLDSSDILMLTVNGFAASVETVGIALIEIDSTLGKWALFTLQEAILAWSHIQETTPAIYNHIS